ncbi:hypothetical protein A2Z33_05560 [Candidatus Gottesmanbacteria bacterium RBG_16_52_11]|uniref:Glycosyltransferase 2-like domain-containing protein n=1 Tax=Candidatus Gottesmanbacteria bacterium RBG_16_52_11 TaxID=1798374 RepID=A0A1F5YNA7_9BACT|nr:MAG: hypothetical protein A2Z33_05560 [Candidatus Gottesmanbacteria bacterium RBG_16_52_11]
MRRSVILDLGGYDEDFFLWLHEEDLALRIRASGYSVLFDPELVIFHHDPPDKPFRRNYFRYVFRNKARLNLKYFALPLLAVMVPRDLIWILIEAWRFRSSAVITNGLKGYLTGYIEDRPARKKSGLLPGKLQMEYVFTFWTGFYFQAA